MAGINTTTALVLFFLKGAVPEEDEINNAKAIADGLADRREPAKVVFRNGSIPLNGRPEDAKYVAGNVPAGYEAFAHISETGEVTNAEKTAPAIDAHSSGGSTQQPTGAGVSTLAAEVGNANGGAAKGWGA